VLIFSWASFQLILKRSPEVESHPKMMHISRSVYEPSFSPWHTRRGV